MQQAMQVLNHPPGHISSQLQLNVLLANDNIPEAFHHARLYEDDAGRPLLEHFFRHCIGAKKFNVLGSLCLREEEEQLVYRLLRQCKTRKADCVQLILLLKRCKYIEAVSFMDEVAAERQGDGYNDDPNSILSAYRTTMAPVNQSIAVTYFRIRNNLHGPQLKNVAPEPFSCQLAKQNTNGMLGDIFQSSALSAHWATRYTSEPRTLNGPNMPFLRNAAQGAGNVFGQRRIVRPTPYQHVEKRPLEPEQGQASKRRRVATGGDQFRQVMSNFVQRIQQLKQADGERQLEMERQQKRDSEQVLALMKPPDYLQEIEQKQNAPLVSGENAVLAVPPTILRRRASDLQRNYSFMAPIPLEGSRQEPQLQRQESEPEQQEEQVEEEEETDEIIVEIQQQTESQSESDTDEEYMSPLASANNSFVQPQPQQHHEIAPPTGPQPRNSLQQFQQQQQQGSSGFGSFASSIQSGSTSGLLFVPPVCSSKMVEVQQQSSVRISERTTICGDLNETSLAVTASSLWPMPSVSLGTPVQRQPLQRLDTTLGMSSYDVTAAIDTPAARGAAVAQAPTEYIELDNEEEQEAERNRSRHRLSSISDDEPVEMDYQPSSYSVSSELSDSGSPTTARPDAPVYSIVVESTTSITTSRSPTSNTPPSFLPSDTNVSQNSSPRATVGAGGVGGAAGAAGDGSNRSIYRANSLETVDDLDTTKGSLEEDDDVDMMDEDECVIALDGTEVRGYVARPQPVATCSSAELFSFKKDETVEERSAEHLPCPSLGATLGGNSDSAMGYTINLDSVESTGEMAASDVRIVSASDGATSNESVATVHKQQEHQDAEQIDQSMDQATGECAIESRPDQVEDVIDSMEETASDQVILVESDCELVETTAHESDVEIVERSMYSTRADSRSIVLTVSDNEEEEATDQQTERKTQEENKRQEEQQQQEEQLKKEKQKQEMQQQEEKRLREEELLQEEKQRLEEEKRQQEEQRLEEEKRQEEERRQQEEKQRQEEEKQRQEEVKQRQEEKLLQKEKQRQEAKQRQEEKQRQKQKKQQQEKKQHEKEENQQGEERVQTEKDEEIEAENEQMEIDEEQEKQQQKPQRKKKNQKEVKDELPGVSAKHPMVRLLRTRHNQQAAPAQGAAADSPAISPPPSTSTSPVLHKRRRLLSSDRKQSSSPTGRGTPSPVTSRRQRAPSSDETGRERRRRLRSDDSVASVDSQAELVKRQLRAGSMPAMSTVPVSTPKRRTRLLSKPLEVIQEIGESSLLPRTRSRTQLNQSIADYSYTPKRTLRSTSEPPLEADAAAAAVKAQTKPKRTRKASVASDTSAQDSPQTRVLRSRRNTVDEPQPAVSPAPSPTPEVSHGKSIFFHIFP